LFFENPADPAADVESNTLSGEGATYTYNAFNRLTTATKAGVTSTYAINALGQRVHKKVGAGPNQWFTYSPGGQLLGEFQGSWSNYVWLGGMPVARIKDGQVHLIHTDHLGRPEIVTNSAKAVVWRASNHAFDRTVTQDSIGGLNLGFPGQYHDAETGLAYNYFRTYNPRTGRYLESDPIGLAGGLNTYSYANSNPASFVDPHGKIAWKAVVAVVACAYGVHTGVEGASAYKDAIREYDAKALDEANRREKEDPCPNDFNDYFDEKQHRDGLNARIRHGASEVGGEIWGRAVVSTVVVGAVVGDSFIKGGSVGLLCFGAGLAYGYFGD
jgi:RHS repeat-associated protein